jgi:hypothetical protein
MLTLKISDNNNAIKYANNFVIYYIFKTVFNQSLLYPYIK